MGIIGGILGVYLDNGRGNGNYRNYIGIGCTLGLYWDNGKENGNYFSILGFCVCANTLSSQYQPFKKRGSLKIIVLLKDPRHYTELW